MKPYIFEATALVHIKAPNVNAAMRMAHAYEDVLYPMQNIAVGIRQHYWTTQYPEGRTVESSEYRVQATCLGLTKVRLIQDRAPRSVLEGTVLELQSATPVNRAHAYLIEEALKFARFALGEINGG